MVDHECFPVRMCTYVRFCRYGCIRIPRYVSACTCARAFGHIIVVRSTRVDAQICLYVKRACTYKSMSLCMRACRHEARACALAVRFARYSSSCSCSHLFPRFWHIVVGHGYLRFFQVLPLHHFSLSIIFLSAFRAS